MSFLKQYISNEGFALGLENDEVTVGDDVQVAEALGEANAVRQDIENTAADIERGAAVADELELQNDALQAVAEENGGTIPESTAAGFELARRAAVTAVGIDPESEEGVDAVDAAGLESYAKGLISLEEAQEKNKGFLQKIKDGLKAAWKWIVEKVKAFIKWVGKITNILPKKFRSTYNDVKAMTDEAFDRGLASMLSAANEREKLLRLIVNNKIADLADVSSNVADFLEGCKLGIFASIKFGYNVGRGDNALTKEEGEEFYRKAAIQALDNIRKKAGDTVVVNGIEYRISAKGGKFEVEEKTAYKDTNPSFSRKDMLDSLNQGIISEKLFERAAKHIEEIEKNKEAEKLTEKADNPAHGKYLRHLFAIASKLTATSIKLHHELTAHRNNLVNVAKIIVTEGNRKEEKDSDK